MYSDSLFNKGFEFIWGFKLYWTCWWHYPALCLLIRTILAAGWRPILKSFPLSYIWLPFPLPPSLSRSLIHSLWHILTLCSISREISPATHTHLPKSAAIYRWLFSAIIRRVMHPDPDYIFHRFVFASSCAILKLVSSIFREHVCCDCFYWFVNSLDWAEKPNRNAEGTWLREAGV